MTDRNEVSLEKILAKLSGASQKSKRDLQVVLTELAAWINTNDLATPADITAAATPDATTTTKGKVELATAAEAQLGTATALATTPAGILQVIKNLHLISFLGRNGAGSCTASGLHVDDIVVAVASTVTKGALYDKFEAVITVANEIQQTAADDLAAEEPIAIVYRPA